MTRISAWLTAMFLALAPQIAPAQNTPAQEAAIAEFLGLIYEPDRGFVAARELLGDSFAGHLHRDGTPLTIQQLDRLGAAYDPTTDTPLTAGMLYFHLAKPIALLRDLGGGGNEVFARQMEIRLRWLAGDTAAARLQAEDLVTQYAEIGGTDAQMTSLLADAAILAWRDGDQPAARGFLERAQACGVPRCPDDLVFAWLGTNPKPNEETYPGYDPDKLLARALADAPDLVAQPDQMLDDIRAEWRFTTGAWSREFRQALDQSHTTATLTRAERRNIRRIADRMQSMHDMAIYLLGHDSYAEDFAKLARKGPITAQTLAALGLSYSGGSPSWADDLIMEYWPMLHRLYLASDRPGDVIVARAIPARLMLLDNDPARALDHLTRLISDARGQGFSDAQLHSILMDQWAAAVLAGADDIAAATFDATRACRAQDCPADLIPRLSERYNHLPRTVFPTSSRAALRTQADAFLQEIFPGDFLKLADLYRTGAGGGQSRPIEAARDDVLSFEFAEKADTLALADLVQRASWTMDTLIYAGLYRDAAQIGDRTADRVARHGTDSDLSIDFFVKRARANSRLGLPQAEQFYDQAVTRTLALPDTAKGRNQTVSDLALDLLDTGYDNALLRLIGTAPDRADIRARVLFRQGDPAQAAAVYETFRHSREPLLSRSFEVLGTLFDSRAQTHLTGGNLDAAVAAMLTRDAIAAGDDFPVEHPLLYATNGYLRAMALQEAHYRSAAGDTAAVARLRALGQIPGWPAQWSSLDIPPTPDMIASFKAETTGFSNSYDLIRPIIEFRDTGNYQGAAAWLRGYSWVAKNAELNGTYADAQTLWQMAFTFARTGDTDIAFDLMDRAARIAATLSFEGAASGSLQLLERDRWRYLLFVDIAWAALSGQAPEEMLVVSRY